MFEKAVKSKIGKFTKPDMMELCPEIGKESVESSLKAMYEEALIKRKGKGMCVETNSIALNDEENCRLFNSSQKPTLNASILYVRSRIGEYI